MRKLFMFNMVSLDGFFAGEDGNIDWHVADDEFNHFAVEFNTNIYKVDTILFGRTTYQIFENFWPKALKAAETSPEDRIIAQIIEDAEKHVFSKSLDKAEWANSVLHHELAPEFIKDLKARDGSDIVIWGSGTICSALTKLGLIDEYVFMFNPVILGRGKSLFKDIAETITLERTDIQQFKSGNLLVTYKPRS